MDREPSPFFFTWTLSFDLHPPARDYHEQVRYVTFETARWSRAIREVFWWQLLRRSFVLGQYRPCRCHSFSRSASVGYQRAISLVKSLVLQRTERSVPAASSQPEVNIDARVKDWAFVHGKCSSDVGMCYRSCLVYLLFSYFDFDRKWMTNRQAFERPYIDALWQRLPISALFVHNLRSEQKRWFARINTKVYLFFLRVSVSALVNVLIFSVDQWTSSEVLLRWKEGKAEQTFVAITFPFVLVLDRIAKG